MLEAEAAAAACCIQRMARQVHTEGQQRQVVELLHRKRHERQQMARTAQQPSLDAAFEAPGPSRRSDLALTAKAHLEQRPPAETLLKHEEHRGVELEERLRELQVRRRPLARCASPCHATPLLVQHPFSCGTPLACDTP